MKGKVKFSEMSEKEIASCVEKSKKKTPRIKFNQIGESRIKKAYLIESDFLIQPTFEMTLLDARDEAVWLLTKAKPRAKYVEIVEVMFMRRFGARREGQDDE